MAFCHRSIFQSGSLHQLLHFSSLAALFCPPSGSATHRSLTQLSFCPLSLPVTYFAEVRQFETLVYLISTNIYYAEPKENDLIPDLDIKLTPGSGRRMTSHVVDCIAVKRIFWLYITVQVKCKYTLLLVFECVQDKRKRKKGCRNNTAWDNCSSLLGCSAGRLDLTTVVSQLHVLSNILTHNAWLHNSKSLLNY